MPGALTGTTAGEVVSKLFDCIRGQRFQRGGNRLMQLLALDQQIYRPSASFDHTASVTAVRAWLRLALKPASWKPVATEHADA